MQKCGDPQKQPLPPAKTVYLLHAVKDGQRDLLKRLASAPAAHVALAYVLRAGDDVLLEIMLFPDDLMLLGVLVCHAVAERHARRPDHLSAHHLGYPVDQYTRNIEKRDIFLRHIQRLRRLLVRLGTNPLQKCLHGGRFYTALLQPQHVFPDNGGQIIVHHNYVFNLPVFQIQLLKKHNLGAYHLVEYHLVLSGTDIQPPELVLQPQHSQPHILGRHERVLVKEGNLDTAASNVHDRGSLLHDLVETPSGSNRLIV